MSVLGFLHLPGTKKLPDNDRHSVSKRDERNVEHVVHRIRDVLRRNRVKPPKRECLVQQKDADRPQRFIHKEWCACQEELLHRAWRDFHRPVDSTDVRMNPAVSMQPYDEDHHLHNPGDYGGDGGSVHAHPGEPELPVDQKVIEREVHKDSSQPRVHGNHGLTAFTQSAGIGA